MFGLLILAVVLLVLRMVAVSRRRGGFMAGYLFWYVQGHSDSLHALYGEPQRHEDQKKFDQESMHVFMLAVKPAKCKQGVNSCIAYGVSFVPGPDIHCSKLTVRKLA